MKAAVPAIDPKRPLRLTFVFGGAAVVFAVATMALASGQHRSAKSASPSHATAPDAGPTVRIQLFTVPPKKALVTWGKKPLGRIAQPRRPLIIERPRDSGPIDLVVRAEGYIPVHTRAYTFSDSKIAVKLTQIAEKSTLLGYRAPPPSDAGVADAGPR